MTTQRPRVSFLIPTLNGAELLPRALGSIRRQDYPQEQVEITVADGGSVDETRAIARNRFNARVIENPNRLAEFGVKEAMLDATGELVVVFAADNELVGDQWLDRVAARFERDDSLAAVYGRLISGADDPSLNKYVELIQSDPLNWFLNRNLDDYLARGTKGSDGGIVFEINPRLPVIWGANGLVLRAEWARPHWARDGYVADVDAFHAMVRAGHTRVVYYPEAFCYHHHVATLGDLRRKWIRNSRTHLLAQAGERDLDWVKVPGFRLRMALWLVYSLLPMFSFLDAVRRAITTGSRYWLYHPATSFLQTVTYAESLVREGSGRHLLRSLIGPANDERGSTAAR
jgi:glycosyltransferase involved in cell wall biosynthesis